MQYQQLLRCKCELSVGRGGTKRSGVWYTASVQSQVIRISGVKTENPAAPRRCYKLRQAWAPR